ncbi:hypothetical protein [Nonomuraea lactucae]|uniref:hypothetical protein n=1 Tax=Nonomuraea lactucae TaxID=2249762 RepID=UPI0013B38ACE|nr:hypothetical protein [Nonomuraea lactucae]
MNKIRNLAVSVVLTGSAVAGLTAAPAAAEAAPSSVAKTSATYSFTFWSPNKEGYFKGTVYRKGGRHYFKGTLWDGGPGPQDFTRVRFRYFDEFGESHLETHKVVSGTKHFGPFRITRDFDIRLCDIGKLGTVWGSRHDVF